MEQKGGMFSKKPQKPIGPSPETKQMMSEVNTVSRRLRMLEERLSNMSKKIEVIEGSLLEIQKKLKLEIKSTNNQFMEQAKQISSTKNDVLTLVKEMGLLAKKEDVDVLTRYIDQWNPIQFVTLEVLEKHIEAVKKEFAK